MTERNSATRIRAWTCDCATRCTSRTCACARQSGSPVCLCSCAANDSATQADDARDANDALSIADRGNADADAPESNPRRRLSPNELVDLRVNGLTNAELAVFLTRVTGVELAVPTALMTETTNKTFTDITMADLIAAFGFERKD